jgi:hypothetical protein
MVKVVNRGRVYNDYSLTVEQPPYRLNRVVRRHLLRDFL